MSKFKYSVVITSAGESKRMRGRIKALLPNRDSLPFLSSIIKKVSSLKPPPKIYVVLGYHQEEIRKSVDLSGVSVVVNPDPSRGMLSSIHEAMKHISLDHFGFMLSPVDYPLVKQETFQRILDVAMENPSKIVSPMYRGRKGHPVFFPKNIYEDLWQSPMDQGARWAVYKNKDLIAEVEVDDEGVRIDIDTPQEYERWIGPLS